MLMEKALYKPLGVDTFRLYCWQWRQFSVYNVPILVKKNCCPPKTEWQTVKLTFHEEAEGLPAKWRLVRSSALVSASRRISLIERLLPTYVFSIPATKTTPSINVMCKPWGGWGERLRDPKSPYTLSPLPRVQAHISSPDIFVPSIPIRFSPGSWLTDQSLCHCPGVNVCTSDHLSLYRHRKLRALLPGKTSVYHSISSSF